MAGLNSGLISALGLALSTLAWPGLAVADDWDYSAHLKGQLNATVYSDDSVFHEALGSRSVDSNLEFRFKTFGKVGSWDFSLDYQAIGMHSESLGLGDALTGGVLPGNRIINDDRRWWNLTTSRVNGDTALIQRLDRASIGYTTHSSVWRFGRQAISWGNGMMFSAMDIFNPFDPAAVDKEYKPGDDMLYGQYLFDNGNDLQGTAVVRRNPLTGDVESDQGSLAFKYHGFIGMQEFDLLAAEHYGDQVFGLGGIFGVGGAIIRGDLTWTRTDLDDVFSAVASVSRSWTWGGKNVSGVLEYYYNGFGQSDGDYSAAALAGNPDLLKRLERGEIFSLARHYLALSAAIELNPLLTLTPNIFVNLKDPSALAQFVVMYNWKQDIQLLGALNIPIGGNGTEYGGIVAPVEGKYFSNEGGLFGQLAWYF